MLWKETVKCLQTSSTLSQAPARKASPIKAGIHELHYYINVLDTEKIPSQ